MKAVILLAFALCIMAVIQNTLGATDSRLLNKIVGIRRIGYKGTWNKNEWRGEDNRGNKLYRRRKVGRFGKYGCTDWSDTSSFDTSDGKSDSFSNECFD